MTLRRKNQMALGIVMLILLLLLDFTFTGIIRQAAEKTDRERMLLNLSRAVVSINGEAQSLSAIAGNWAFSDVTWNYMHNKDSHYVTNTLNRAVLTDIGISSIILVDKDNSVRLFKQPYQIIDHAEVMNTENRRFSNEYAIIRILDAFHDDTGAPRRAVDKDGKLFT